MADNSHLGSKIRRLRQRQEIRQSDLARHIGISPSYLNLIEHNRRPVTAALLLKLADVLEADLKAFSEDDESRLVAELTELLGDALFADNPPDSLELANMAATAPDMCQVTIDLYRAYRGVRDDLQALSERFSEEHYLTTRDYEFRTLLTSVRSFSEILHDNIDLEPEQRRQFLGIIVEESGKLAGLIDQVLEGSDENQTDLGPSLLPSEEVSDFFQQRANYFPELEAAADLLRDEAALKTGDMGHGLGEYLHRSHDVRIETETAASGVIRRFDRQLRRLWLSPALVVQSRTFQLAVQAGLLRCDAEIDGLVAEAGLGAAEGEAICRLALANYFAAALLMPYDEFLAVAQRERYDIDVLCRRFGVSYSQTCHRLSSLRRPNASGVPFHLVRVDIAGNISLRFSASGMRVPRYGGACPRWAVHAAFMAPGAIHRQLERMPDGTTYFGIARTVTATTGFGGPRSHHAIGMGCDVSYARELVYADGLDLDPERALPIGVSCRVCERIDCRQRALPPLSHRLEIDSDLRGPSIHASVESLPVPQQ